MQFELLGPIVSYRADNHPVSSIGNSCIEKKKRWEVSTTIVARGGRGERAYWTEIVEIWNGWGKMGQAA